MAGGYLPESSHSDLATLATFSTVLSPMILSKTTGLSLHLIAIVKQFQAASTGCFNSTAPSSFTEYHRTTLKQLHTHTPNNSNYLRYFTNPTCNYVSLYFPNLYVPAALKAFLRIIIIFYQAWFFLCKSLNYSMGF